MLLFSTTVPSSLWVCLFVLCTSAGRRQQIERTCGYSLSGPPSLVTASTKRSCRSGVHRSRGLGSRDSTTPPIAAAPPYPALSIPSNMLTARPVSRSRPDPRSPRPRPACRSRSSWLACSPRRGSDPHACAATSYLAAREHARPPRPAAAACS